MYTTYTILSVQNSVTLRTFTLLDNHLYHSTSEHLSSSQTETLYPFRQERFITPPLVPGSHHSVFCLYSSLYGQFLAHCPLIFFFSGCIILFSDQGLNPCHLHWEHRVLTTGPPGRSQFTPYL